MYGRLMQICLFGLGIFLMHAVILPEHMNVNDEHTHSHNGHIHEHKEL